MRVSIMGTPSRLQQAMVSAAACVGCSRRRAWMASLRFIKRRCRRDKGI